MASGEDFQESLKVKMADLFYAMPESFSRRRRLTNVLVKYPARNTRSFEDLPWQDKNGRDLTVGEAVEVMWEGQDDVLAYKNPKYQTMAFMHGVKITDILDRDSLMKANFGKLRDDTILHFVDWGEDPDEIPSEGDPANGYDSYVLYPGRKKTILVYLPFENNEGDDLTVAEVIEWCFEYKDEVAKICTHDEVTMALTRDSLVYMTCERDKEMHHYFDDIDKETIIVFVHLKTKEIFATLPPGS